MSERRQAHSTVLDASLKVGEARVAVDEAVRYIEMYDFLRDANQDLLCALHDASEMLAAIEQRLWRSEVKTA